LRDVEPECPAVGGQEHVFPHYTFERFSIDTRHGWRLKVLPR